MMQSQIVSTYIAIRTAINVVGSNGYDLHGEIILTEDNLKLFKEGLLYNIVSSEVLVSGVTIIVDDDFISTNQLATIKLIPKISTDLSEYFIAENGDNFFIQFGRRFCIPKNFYIHNFYSDPKFDKCVFISRLEFAIKINEILNIIKDYKNTLTNCEEFFLFAINPLTIKTLYNDDKLNYIGEATEILNLIQSDFKSEVYKSFLKIQVINLLINVSENERFKTLLTNFKTVHLNFKNSIELYFKEFDVQRNKNDLQNKKIELAKKIHGVVNEIGGKVITIPAAYLLILTELKTDYPTSFLNHIFFFISIIFALIIESSIINQFIFLRTLNKDIEEFVKHSLSSPELQTLFQRYKKELMLSYTTQTRILWFVRITLWFLPVSILIILIYYRCR